MTHNEKRQIISRLINLPDKNKRAFWGKEIKVLNTLIEKYPSKKFWTSLSFYDKLDSMVLLKSGFFANELKAKYQLFNYKIPKPPKYELGEKCGEDIATNTRPKTIKDFLS